MNENEEIDGVEGSVVLLKRGGLLGVAIDIIHNVESFIWIEWIGRWFFSTEDLFVSHDANMSWQWLKSTARLKTLGEVFLVFTREHFSLSLAIHRCTKGGQTPFQDSSKSFRVYQYL